MAALAHRARTAAAPCEGHGHLPPRLDSFLLSGASKLQITDWLLHRINSTNRTKSSVRARVEHVFGAQANDMGGTLVRTIGLVRAKAKIGMKNLAYNMRRLGQLRRLNPRPA